MFIYALNEFYSYEGVCVMFNILMVKIEGQESLHYNTIIHN